MNKLEQYLKSKIPLLKSLEEKINNLNFKDDDDEEKIMNTIYKAIELTTKSLEIISPLYKYLHPKNNDWEIIINNIKNEKYSPLSREMFLKSKDDSIDNLIFHALYDVSLAFIEEVKNDSKPPTLNQAVSWGDRMLLGSLQRVIPYILKAISKFITINPDIKRELGNKSDYNGSKTNFKIYSKVQDIIIHDLQQIARKENFSEFDPDEYSKNEEFLKLKNARDEMYGVKNEDEIIKILKKYGIYEKYFSFLNVNEQFIRMQKLAGLK